MAGALDGLLVVALEQAVAAPACTQRLADGGARVIKIERTEGETARHYDAVVHGDSAYFAWLNRGKQSVVLDIKAVEDRAQLDRMIDRCDVFVQNLAPGAAARLGLDARALSARHPRLIAVDICGYGQDTPYRAMRAYDMLVQAESGICAVTGTPGEMAKVGVSIADIATGMNAHAAILEALIARGFGGRGRAIEIAMFDAMADWMAVPLLHREHGGTITARHGLSHASIFPYAPFRCIDGTIIVAIQSPAEWRRFCSGILDDGALADDPRFADNAARTRHRAALTDIIDAAIGRWSLLEAIAMLERYQIAWGRAASVDDVLAHPALRRIPATGVAGGFDLPRPAGRDGTLPTRIPALGEDSDRIRLEFAA